LTRAAKDKSYYSKLSRKPSVKSDDILVAS